MKEVRTRFAPSPTGYMHIGNLRTALYSYLIAKKNNGKFILRIEDTDQKRYIKDAIQVIYNTLKIAGLNPDEGPEIGGDVGPYVQSERKEIYLKYAKQLIEQGDAYYCFCPEAKTDLDTFKEECHYQNGIGYDRHCRNLSEEEVEQNLKNNKPYVIRQKIPDNVVVSYKDMVYKKIQVESKVLDDQVLIKRDGYPTYNFANVIDDHLMGITHVVRGNEYISSTPKYILLYQAFGWEIPNFVHLPLINGKDENGVVSKLSKRHGATSFEELIKNGYLPEAILNYVTFLGWNPKTNQEVFSLEELIKAFDISFINKNSPIFDYKKLEWFNYQYIKKMSNNDFKSYGESFLKDKINFLDWDFISKNIKSKIFNFTELYTKLDFIISLNDFDIKLFFNEKYNITKNDVIDFINWFLDQIKDNIVLDIEGCNQYLKEYSTLKNVPFGFPMWIFRIALTGQQNTILGGLETAFALGVNEVWKRLKYSLDKVNNYKD